MARDHIIILATYMSGEFFKMAISQRKLKYGMFRKMAMPIIIMIRKQVIY
jgi:hypothetical protein